MGWKGAPTTQSVTYHMRLRAKGIFYTPRGFLNKGKNSFGKVGLGGGFFSNTYGKVNQTGFHLDYAYHIALDNGRLALGLSPVFFQYRLNKLGGLIFPNGGSDPVMTDSTEALTFFDFNAGMHYYSDNGYAGLSVIQLFGSSIRTREFGLPSAENPAQNPDLARTVYGYAGYYFSPNRELKIEPMVLAKYNTSSGFRIDVNTTVHIRDVFSFGAGYRWKQGFTVNAGVRLDNFFARYLFEIPLTSEVPGRFTSHMIQLGFNLGQPIE